MIDFKVTSLYKSDLKKDKNIIKLAMICNYAMICVLLFFSTINIVINGTIILGVVEIVLALLSLSIIVYYNKSKNIKFFLLATTLFLFTALLAYYFNSAKTIFSSVWLFFFPLSVFLLNGLRVGTIGSIIFILTITIDSYLGIGEYTDIVGFLNIAVGLSIFSALAFYFEFNRTVAFENIRKQNEKLELISKENKDLLLQNKKFIAETVHQVGTPLTNIMINSEMIKISVEDEDVIENIDQINASINMITNSYEDLSYITSYNNIEYKPSLISISEILQKRIDFFETISKVNNKQITSNIQKNIYFNINQIECERIIDNNISNAVKYGDNDKLVSIDLKEESGLITLEFKTYGKPVRDASKIFEKNYREDDSKRGLGLGLNMVKNICKKYDIFYILAYEKEKNIFRYIFKK